MCHTLRPLLTDPAWFFSNVFSWSCTWFYCQFPFESTEEWDDSAFVSWPGIAWSWKSCEKTWWGENSTAHRMAEKRKVGSFLPCFLIFPSEAPTANMLHNLVSFPLHLPFSLPQMGQPFGGSAGKEFACNAADLGLIPGLGRSPGEGNGNPLQYSCLENPMDRGAWRATYSPQGCKESDMTEWLTLSLLPQMIALLSAISIPPIFQSSLQIPCSSWSILWLSTSL